MRRVYEVSLVLQISDLIEADSAEDAEQAFSELFTMQELMEYGELTVTETDEVVSDE
jgi:hypothetical protein